ncbi:MAG: hypothetical protein JSR57_09670 [Verrucomicrobia bacterium]|nr:hypothetical protein [Verrucomicrobiota bacterium]
MCNRVYRCGSCIHPRQRVVGYPRTSTHNRSPDFTSPAL